MDEPDSAHENVYKGLLHTCFAQLITFMCSLLFRVSYDGLVMLSFIPVICIFNIFFATVKVQKRGSVGRTIDVTRYIGYDELRHDLARMFGIEGQLEDPQRTEWKLVYVDHENDILLVGDDPWE